MVFCKKRRDGEVGMKPPASAFRAASRMKMEYFGAGDGASPRYVESKGSLAAGALVAVTIPSQKTIHRKRMSQVMDARPTLTLGTAQVETANDFQKDGHEPRMPMSSADHIEEHGGGRVSRKSSPGPTATR